MHGCLLYVYVCIFIYVHVCLLYGCVFVICVHVSGVCVCVSVVCLVCLCACLVCLCVCLVCVCLFGVSLCSSQAGVGRLLYRSSPYVLGQCLSLHLNLLHGLDWLASRP